jgi:phosphoenolpyruvate synthase/pyruvate phosphate dikinase
LPRAVAHTPTQKQSEVATYDSSFQTSRSRRNGRWRRRRGTRLAEGIARIAAAFYPKPVIVRMSDFKSKEYAMLIGGQEFEPTAENPMLGFRGASRYYDERYREGFELECLALHQVREERGLVNVKISPILFHNNFLSSPH